MRERSSARLVNISGSNKLFASRARYFARLVFAARWRVQNPNKRLKKLTRKRQTQMKVKKKSVHR